MKFIKTTVLMCAFVAAVAVQALAGGIGENKLIAAVQEGDFTNTVILLDQGMNPNIVEDRTTPLMLAARAGDFKMARVLIAFGADVNLRNDEGTTPLMLASRYGHTEVVELLLKEGADTSLRNSKGYTSLDLARMFRHEQTAQKLRQADLR